jgi:hypothetical protein
VKVIRRWNGYRPSIGWILKEFWVYLLQERNNQALYDLRQDQKRIRRYGAPNRLSVSKIDWIESLYRKPIDDDRSIDTTST